MKTKHYLYRSALFCGILLLFACSKSSDGPGKELESQYQIDVYVAGYAHNGSKGVAIYWKNGTAVDLTDGSGSASASDIVVDGDDIYIAGNEYNGSRYVAKYWKNGTAVSLPGGNNFAQANAIAVYNGDVHVAGYTTESASSLDVATYWKNGVITKLTGGSRHAYALDVAVNAGDVYIVGYENNSQNIHVATYWKNGTAVSIPLTDGGKYAYAQGVTVDRGHVYIAGDERLQSIVGRGVVMYWKDEAEAVVWGDGTTIDRTTAIFVSGDDVYIGGQSNNNPLSRGVATYWKNGVAVQLSEEPSYINSIFVMDDDVYAAGYEYQGEVRIATYWKNDERVHLSDGVNDGNAASIVVTKTLIK